MHIFGEKRKYCSSARSGGAIGFVISYPLDVENILRVFTICSNENWKMVQTHRKSVVTLIRCRLAQIYVSLMYGEHKFNFKSIFNLFSRT